MVEPSRWFRKKKETIHQLKSNYQAWDGSSEEAAQVLNSNEELFKRVEEIDQHLTLEEKKAFSDEHLEMWKQIIQLHQHMMDTFKLEKNSLLKELEGMPKKKEAASQYMQQDNSMFIDRDV